MISFKTILCPVDFSEHTQHALNYGVSLARQYDATLVLCHVVEIPVVAPPMEPLVEVGTSMQDANAAATEELTKLAKEIQSRVSKLVPILTEGSSASEILNIAEEHNADLLIVASHGMGGFDRFIFGSTTEKLLTKASCPVLIVHVPEREFVNETSGEIELRHILVGVDFSSCSDLALSYALGLTKQYKSKLTVAHVHEGKEEPSEESISCVAKVKEQIHRALPQGDQFPKLGEVVILTGKPDKELVRFAEEQSVDLLVIGARSHGLLSDLFFSSHSEKIVRSAPCPVLSICETSHTHDHKEETK